MIVPDDSSSGFSRLETLCPAWERSAHTAVGQVIITTCTVSTLPHSGRLRKPQRVIVILSQFNGTVRRRFLKTDQCHRVVHETKTSAAAVTVKVCGHRRLRVVLTRAVDRRRMERRVRAEVKVVSLLTRASFLIST